MSTIRYIDRKTGRLAEETVPGEGWLKWLYHTPTGALALEAVVKRKILSAWYGSRMDEPTSKKKIPGFVQSLGIDMNEAAQPIEAYDTFNEFFIRPLRPEARPICTDDDAIVSPADGKMLAFEGMSGLDSFFVKGKEFSLKTFLRNDILAERYARGTLVIVRLAPADYHRFHFPANGRISATTPIKGAYYSVSPLAVRERLGIYWENKREYSMLTTVNAGSILMCEVGATMVGSIIQAYPQNTHVMKGREKGWFAFGGSTVVLLLEKGKAQVDADIIHNTKKGLETKVRMGERIATALG